ncbi:hypothetical protein [Haliangium sp.]|uniref:hypothetical protein n=1 Tax=Haliangium sp. TaxID=2663208 RepID=UPI003D110678
MTALYLEPLLTVVGLLSLGVFVLAFKFAFHESLEQSEQSVAPHLPRAAVGQVRGMQAARWGRAARGHRLLAVGRVLQAGVMAAGVTSVFVMILCTLGMVATMLVR